MSSGYPQSPREVFTRRPLDLSFDVIVTSPKKRAKQTAALVAAAIGFPLSDIVETDQVKDAR